MSQPHYDDDNDNESAFAQKDESGPTFVECPYCDARPLKANYWEHLRSRHADKQEEEDFLAWNKMTGLTLRRKGEAKRPPSERSDLPGGMGRCPVCQALVPRSRLNEHIERYHTEQEEEPLEKCRLCGVEVRAGRMERHMRRVHRADK